MRNKNVPVGIPPDIWTAYGDDGGDRKSRYNRAPVSCRTRKCGIIVPPPVPGERSRTVRSPRIRRHDRANKGVRGSGLMTNETPLPASPNLLLVFQFRVSFIPSDWQLRRPRGWPVDSRAAQRASINLSYSSCHRRVVASVDERSDMHNRYGGPSSSAASCGRLLLRRQRDDVNYSWTSCVSADKELARGGGGSIGRRLQTMIGTRK
jgi:hypothetical protein